MWFIVNRIQLVLMMLWTCVCGTLAFLILIPTQNERLTMLVPNYLWGHGLFLIALSRLKVLGRDEIDITKPRIWVSNHESNMDIPAMFMALPVDVYFIAKKELKKIPFIGWFVGAIGMVFIDRSDKGKAMDSMREAGELIKQGRNVIAFPEGTRNLDGQVKMFKRGTFIIALESDIEIVPVAIKGTRDVVASGGIRIRPNRVKVQIGEPISGKQAGFGPDEVDKFATYIRDRVVAMRKDL